MSYIDLTDSWEHGTLITTTLLQNMADDVIADNIGGDPLITTDDFKLTSSSPCIDTGITLTYITDDYLGRTRPNNLYDIGAFEYFHAYMTNMTINTGTIK